MPSSTQTAPTVFVVDDDISVRESLHQLIGCAGFRPECFACGNDFLVHPRADEPSCLLLDVNLPDLNGLDLQKQVAADRSEMPIIFITGCADVAVTVRAMKAGAAEFLLKPFKDDVLLAAIEQAIERSRAALQAANEMRLLKNRYATLTPREREVMSLVASGLLNKQVAGELGLSEVTVKGHRGKVTHKMKARTVSSLLSMAAKLGLPGPR